MSRPIDEFEEEIEELIKIFRQDRCLADNDMAEVLERKAEELYE